MSAAPDERLMPHFLVSELACPHCGACEMDPVFMDRLEALRLVVGVTFKINSGFRCPTHDLAVGGEGKPINHVAGKAVDIAIAGAPAWQITSIARAFGFTGMGTRQHGPHERRFIHLDTFHDEWTTWDYA